MKALQEVKFYQSTTELLIKSLPFKRLVRETMGKFTERINRIQADALYGLQVSQCWQDLIFPR